MLNYFVIGVGGTGAKLMQTLVHLSAAGLLPGKGSGLDGLLVDPDDANGNVEECNRVAKSYSLCSALAMGECDLFAHKVSVIGPWTPIRTRTIDTLNEIFQYTQRREHMPKESELLELLFSERERNMPIHQGFRGRPAIGSAVLSNAINFSDQGDVWYKLMERARNTEHSESGVPVLLAGSVFGGSGAAGMPTILKLLKLPSNDGVNRLRLGLTLFLPYFTFEQIPGEVVQADPAAFALATAEALKYYADPQTGIQCSSIYALGERVPSQVAKSAVGSADQRNEPHFLELVAGLGAIDFFGGGSHSNDDHVFSVAGRAKEGTLTWTDLPAGAGQQPLVIAKLQRMIRFAVAFHLKFYPYMVSELHARGETRNALLRHCVVNERVPKEVVLRDLANVNTYVMSFLTWLLKVSDPRRGGFTPGLVNVNVFAERNSANEFVLRTELRKESDFEGLLIEAAGREQPGLKQVLKNANELHVNDVNAKGTGRLIRTIYDSCEL